MPSVGILTCIYVRFGENHGKLRKARSTSATGNWTTRHPRQSILSAEPLGRCLDPLCLGVNHNLYLGFNKRLQPMQIWFLSMFSLPFKCVHKDQNTLHNYINDLFCAFIIFVWIALNAIISLLKNYFVKSCYIYTRFKPPVLIYMFASSRNYKY